MSGVSDAVEILAGAGPVVLTCEHASVRMPSPWAWPDADRWLVGTHWSYDLGVADLVRDLAAKTGWPAVLSRFTRLLADPNRPEDHVDLFRTHAEGRPIHLNAGLPEDEIARWQDAEANDDFKTPPKRKRKPKGSVLKRKRDEVWRATPVAKWKLASPERDALLRASE